MGIRFACHVCKKQLNIKRELAGRRGVCPQCQARFRIPMEDTEESTPVDAVRMVQPQLVSHSEQVDTAKQGARAVVAGNNLVSQAAISAESVTKPALQDEAKPSLHAQSAQKAGGQHPVVASILEDEPSATWYVRPPSGGQYGPASTDELCEWIGQGRVAASALLWRDGWPQWRDAAEALPELSHKLPDATGAADNGDKSAVEVGSGTLQNQEKNSGISLSGDTGIGAERRSRTMRRISLIAILIAITALLLGVLFYVINR